jgi:hypothetical protein
MVKSAIGYETLNAARSTLGDAEIVSKVNEYVEMILNFDTATPPEPPTAPLSLVTKDDIRKSYTTQQHGNDYLTVQGRVLIFRLDHPDWGIETEHIILTEDTAAFKATIRNATGQVIACGHGMATKAGTAKLGGRYVEKAETAAIGRALAHAGFGTDSSLDDSDYLADSPQVKAA